MHKGLTIGIQDIDFQLFSFLPVEAMVAHCSKMKGYLSWDINASSTDVMVIVYVHANTKSSTRSQRLCSETPRLAHSCFSFPNGTKPKRVKGIL